MLTRDVIHSFLDAVELRDVEAAAACFADDAPYRNMPHPAVLGPTGVRAMLSNFLAASSNVCWDVITEAYADNRGHLERIDRLKEGIHLRAHAQKDPLIEYKKEAFSAFQEMNAWIYEETVEKLMKIKLVNQERAREVLQDRQELDLSELNYAGADENAAFVPQQSRAPQGPATTQAQPPQRQMMTYGPGDGEGPQLNREQRRQQEKKAKKKKLKI